jgi:hypothetical protein
MMIAREDFVSFGCHESMKSYVAHLFIAALNYVF